MATYVKIRIRRDTSENWASANPLLLLGEIGCDMSKRRIKVGDGVSRWNDLKWINQDIYDMIDSGNFGSGGGSGITVVVNNTQLPASPSAGDLVYVASDKKIYYWDGSKWVELGANNNQSAQSAGDLPNNPSVGELIYVVSEDKYYYWNATKWVELKMSSSSGGGVTVVSNGNRPTEKSVGMLIYDETAKQFFVWTGTEWKKLDVEGSSAGALNRSDVIDIVNEKTATYGIFGQSYEFTGFNRSGRPLGITFGDGVTCTITWDGDQIDKIVASTGETVQFNYSQAGELLGRTVTKASS